MDDSAHEDLRFNEETKIFEKTKIKRNMDEKWTKQ